MSSSVHFHSLETDDDAFRLTTLPTGWKLRQGFGRDSIFSSKCLAVAALSTVAVVTLFMSVASMVMAQDTWRELQAMPHGATAPTTTPAQPSFRPISRIAFGSCTSYDTRPQPVWDAVVASRPDAWIWLGDMAYTDNPDVDCSQVPLSPQCNCTPNFMRSAPFQCFAGDIDHIRQRFMRQINLPGYRKFLEFMCPGNAMLPQSPAQGSDPEACPRPVLGTYDDHDSGWNNGNDRMPGKHVVKNLFLDAIGEPQSSPRRTSTAGLQTSYTLQGPALEPSKSSSRSGGSGTSQEVHVVLLDERYYRDPVPCSMRSDWCEMVLGLTAPPSIPKSAAAWCRDFLRDDGSLGIGSCCPRDGKLQKWCTQAGVNESHPLWNTACDPTSLAFGLTPLAFGPEPDSEPQLVDGAVYEKQQAELWPWLVQASPICDVLGVTQRQWLQRELASSNAALHVIASGSVPFGSIGYSNEEGKCSGDDWECWKPAQINFLHSLASSTKRGCVLILTGDYHYADIKVVMPGRNSAYSSDLRTDGLSRPVWQFMSSGMTSSTAAHADNTCAGSYLEDLVGLRPLGKCSYFSGPNFGTIDIDWEAQEVTLRVRDGDSGGAAADRDGVLQEQSFSLETCMPL